jgi:hypothetical protein
MPVVQRFLKKDIVKDGIGPGGHHGGRLIRLIEKL